MINELAEATGIVSEDPANGLASGEQILFAQKLFQLPFVERYGAIRPFWEIFQGALLTVSIKERDTLVCHGSAVVVASGKALCARHVLQPFANAIMAGAVSVLCAGITASGLQLWAVRHMTFGRENDLAILGLVAASSFPPDRLYVQATMDARLPAEGESVRMYGFVHSGEPAETIIAGSLIASRGVVSKRYDRGRDRAMCPWPGFEVACNAVGGMSGGPVFNEEGYLVGLVCSGYEQPDELGPAYVSALWPALALQYIGGWPIGMFPGSRRLLDLELPGWNIRNADLVDITEIHGEPHAVYLAT